MRPPVFLLIPLLALTLVTGCYGDDPVVAPAPDVPETEEVTEDTTEDGASNGDGASNEDGTSNEDAATEDTGPTTVCGDGACDEGEDADSCPEDCEVIEDPVCGDGSCDAGEDVDNCPDDCSDTTECVDFDGILAIFSNYGCTGCHGSSGGLGLATYEAVMSGGDNGPAVGVTLQGSTLYTKCLDEPPFGTQMPLGGNPVSDEDLAVIADWIEDGAPETCPDSPACGDGSCDEGEDATSCPEDCVAPSTCGDGSCDEGEDATSCPDDCGGEPACVDFSTALAIFDSNGCIGCHTGPYSGGLDLNTYELFLAGGANGPSHVVGDGAGSILVTKLKTETLPFGQVMPLGGADTVSDGDIQTLIDWIDAGAPETCDGPAPLPTCDDGEQNGDEEGVDCGGANCDACQVADPCDGVDCGDNGSCVEGACECTGGFSGDNCEIAPDPCAGVDCGDNGSCIEGACECTGGFSGDSCEIAPDPCAGVDCGDNGSCVEGACECTGGYSGANCETAPGAAEAFCALYETTCGDWEDLENDCEDWYNAAPAGEAGSTSGANQACYEYHLGVADAQDDAPSIATHCAHAAGLTDAENYAPCTDPEPECGDGVCEEGETQDDCAVDCTPCTTEGETKGVFPGASCCEGLTSIGKSSYDEAAGACSPPLLGATWCTDCGDGVCDDPENACNCAADCDPGFCQSYNATCGDWPDLANTCEDWFAAAPVGDDGATSGANQACYEYHLGVAIDQDDQGSIDTHCAHAAGLEDAESFAPCTDPEPEPAACVPYSDVKTVFDTYGCTGCHGGQGGLTLSTYDALLGSGTVAIGDHGSSTLWLKLKGNGGNMPLNSQTVDPDTDMKVIEGWIDSGANDTCP